MGSIWIEALRATATAMQAQAVVVDAAQKSGYYEDLGDAYDDMKKLRTRFIDLFDHVATPKHEKIN